MCPRPRRVRNARQYGSRPVNDPRTAAASGLARWTRGGRAAPYEPLRRLVEAFDREEGADRVLYFGDSVVERVSRDDADTRPLGQMVSDGLAHRYETCVVSYSALRPDGYLALSRVLGITRSRPRLALLPVNVRCFSPQWDWNPSFDFAREIAAIEAYCRAPGRGIPRLIPTNKLPVRFWKRWAFHRRRVCYPLAEPDRVGGFARVIATKPADAAAVDFRWRQIFIFHYLHPLAADHRQMRALGHLLRQLRALDVRVLSYVTPINYQAGVRLVGEEFATRVSETVGKVLSLVAEEGGEAPVDPAGRRQAVADWSSLLPEDCFFHRNEPTEHLNERGRRRLAEAVTALALRD